MQNPPTPARAMLKDKCNKIEANNGSKYTINAPEGANALRAHFLKPKRPPQRLTKHD
jgi:hypothetical protein